MTDITALSFSPSTLLGTSLFVFGLMVGSFLNVVGLRYQKQSLGGRSFCPHCKKKLNWFELIPLLSFVIQLGKCRGCRKKISWQYPIVELITGFIFLLPLYFYNYYYFPPHAYREWLALIWLLIALAMLVLSVIDWRQMIIPDGINIFLAVMGFVLMFLGSTSFLRNYSEWLAPSRVEGLAGIFINHFLAGFIGTAFLGIIVLLTWGRAMGMGDVKLAGAMGLILGWPDITLALCLSFLVGGVWASILLLLRKKKLKTMVPFGPFLVTGFWLEIFFGHQILNWYFSFI